MGDVSGAVSTTKDRLDQGIFDWDVSKGDLNDITSEVNKLSPQERNEFISRLSDDDLKNWTQEIDGLSGSLSANERADLFETLAAGMDGTQLTRFVKAFDGSPGGRDALGDAVAGHASPEAKVAFIDATKGSIDGEYKATQGRDGNPETAVIAKVLGSLGNDPAAFGEAVNSLSESQLRDVMTVAMNRTYVADPTGMSAGRNFYDPSALLDILGAAPGQDLATRTAIFQAAEPQLKTMQSENGASADTIGQAMGQVLSREEAVKAGIVQAPASPPGVSVDANIKEAQNHVFPADLPWFYDQVKGGGPWDYKQQGAQYENFGNFHYGLMAAAMGIPEDVALRAAGYAQEQAGTSKDEWGNPYDLGGSYGDDPNDQAQIQQGYDYHDSGLWRVWSD